MKQKMDVNVKKGKWQLSFQVSSSLSLTLPALHYSVLCCTYY